MLGKSIITLSLIASVAMAGGHHGEHKGHHGEHKGHHGEHKGHHGEHKGHHGKMHKGMKAHKHAVRAEMKAYRQEMRALKPLTLKSHSNYAQNKHGVITTDTLTDWIDNWEENKPDHIEGKLVILQGGPTLYADAGKGYITPDEENGVYVYDIGLKGACDSSFKRFDGVSEIQGAIINPDMMNFQLNALNIDPSKDMVVLVSTASSNDAMKGLARIWMTFKYFSVDMKHISFLDGSASYNFAPDTEENKYLGATPSGWPQFGNFDVRDLGPSGTATIATMEDMMKDASEKVDFHFITDGRGSKEYTGASGSKASDKTCGEDGASQCYTAFRGHIKTAVDMSYTNFYDTTATEDVNGDGEITSADASYKFKTYNELKDYFAENGYKKGQIVDAYCRTGRKANLALMTASEILGYPARLYDGSWIQWGELANATDSNGTEILPADNKWRTDVAKYSEVIKYEDSINVQPIVHVDYNETNTINNGTDVRVDPNGTTTALQVQEDSDTLSE